MPTANRSYNPRAYDAYFAQGKLAAETGKPRNPIGGSINFWYGYEAICWLDGYDSVPPRATRMTKETW